MTMRDPYFSVPAAVSALFLHSANNQRRLRLGVLCDGPQLPRYVRGVLDDLLRADFVDLAVVAEVSYRHASDGLHKESLAMRVLSAPVEARYQHNADPLELVPFGDLLLSIERLKFNAATVDRSIELTAADALQLRAANLDVLLNFCARPLKVAEALLATHGVWYFHFGDSRKYPEGSGFLRELVDGSALSGIELIQQSGSAGGAAVLSRALFSTTPFPSRFVNRFAPVWGARHFVIQNLWELSESGELRQVVDSADAGKQSVASRVPGSGEVIAWLAVEVGRRLLRARLTTQGPLKWRVGVRRSRTALFEESGEDLMSSFKWLDAPEGHYWADPVLCEVAGKPWLFFEHMVESDGIAQISCGRLVGDCELVDVRTVLRRPHHLSYPQIIQSDGDIYMLPEAAQSGGLDLYRARRFPDEWVLEARLLDFRCVDSSVFKFGGTWWMVTSPQVAPGHAPITWLLQADHLTGPWRYCPHGVVASSAAVARGAGAVFEHHERLIRPSQDCSRRYGEALVFNEIKSLRANEYQESTFRRVEGGGVPRLAGVHSYTRLDDWEAIDGGFKP